MAKKAKAKAEVCVMCKYLKAVEAGARKELITHMGYFHPVEPVEPPSVSSAAMDLDTG